MAFGNPLLLWGLLAVAVPLAIHLLHRRRAKTLLFPAIDFILRSRKAVQRRFRLKQILLLVLRCLLVGAAAFAAARPLFPGSDAAIGPSGEPAAVAVMIDRSFSMRARAGGDSAFDEAKRAAEALIRGMGPDVEAVLVPFDDDARAVPAVPTADKSALLASLAEIAVGYRGTNLARATEVAAQAIAGSEKPRKTVYLFTDGARAGWQEVVPRDPADGIVWRVVDVLGPVPPNAAAARLEVHEEGSGTAASVEVRSFASEAQNGLAVEIGLGDRPAGRNFVDVPAGGSTTTTFTLPAPPAGLNEAVARISPDALAEDDARFAVFRGRARVRTLLVDGDPKTTIRDAETFFLERALAPSRAAGGSVAPVVVDAEGLSRADLSRFDVVVLANVGTLPSMTTAALKRWVQNGGGLLVAAGDRVEADVANLAFGELLPMRLRGTRSAVPSASEGGMAAHATALTLAPVGPGHPVTQAIDTGAADVFGSVAFRTVLLLEGGKAETILRFADGSPALVERTLGRGRVALFASSLDREWNDLPIATVFLPLARRLVRYLAGELGESGSVDLTVGRPVQIEVGVDHKEIRVDGPTPFPAAVVPVIQGIAEIVPTEPGIYRLSRADALPDERLASKGFAVNVDIAESELRNVDDAEIARVFPGSESEPVGGTAGSSPDRPMWTVFLAVALVALIAEGMVTGA